MEGRIIGNISNQYFVKSENEIYTCMARGKIKNKDMQPVVGDIVNITITSKEKYEAVLEEIQDRKNYSKRPKMSNLDQLVLVVSSKDPKPDLFMLDKQLIYANFLNIPAIIVVNKEDLDDKKSFLEIKERYEKIGYKVLGTVASKKEGINDIISLLKGKISAFSGNSGVGKSTLLNAIFEEEMTKEGSISKKNKKGKNTTTTVYLYELEKDTYIADTPGFSTFSIEEIECKDVAKHFKEFIPYMDECEFVGCSHIKERNCGIKKAVEGKKIDSKRYEHYCTIYLDQKDKEDHKW